MIQCIKDVNLMCLNENIFILIDKILLISSIIIPFLYLLYFYFKKNKKKLQIGYFIIAILLFSGIFYIRWNVINMEICDETLKPVYKDNDKNKNNENDKNNENNPNYVKTTPKGYILTKKDGAYYIDNYLIVNKTYPLDNDWVPKNTYVEFDAGNKDICHLCIDKVAYDKWLEMKSDADSIGLTIFIASGYRSFGYQEDLYNKYLNQDGKKLADTYSARAGHSEHQSGLSFDLNSIDSSFAATNEGKWVADNAYLYGFIIRFPKDKSDETGYKYEPWHLRYVGLELAKKLYNNGNWVSMESYFGIDSKYQ